MKTERIVKNRDPWHIITIRDRYDGEFCLVGGGRPYLSVHAGNPGHKGFAALGGQTSLRRLAYAILRSVKPRRSDVSRERPKVKP